MPYHKNAKPKFRYVLLTVVFGLIFLSVVPTILGSHSTKMQLAFAQPEDPFPMPVSNLTQEQLKRPGTAAETGRLFCENACDKF